MKKLIPFLLALNLLFLAGCGFMADRVKVTDALCPYTIESQKDGSLRLEVDTGELAGYVWQQEMRWEDICQAEINQEDTSTVITLTGLTPGVEELSFVCLKEGDNLDQRFAIDLEVSVDGSNRVTLNTYENRSLTGAGASPEDVKIPHNWSTNQEGVMTLYVPCGEPSDWSCALEENDFFAVQNLYYDWEWYSLNIVPKAAGEGTVVMVNDVTGQEVSIHVTVDEDLVITVLLDTEAEGLIEAPEEDNLKDLNEDDGEADEGEAGDGETDEASASEAETEDTEDDAEAAA